MANSVAPPMHGGFRPQNEAAGPMNDGPRTWQRHVPSRDPFGSTMLNVRVAGWFGKLGGAEVLSNSALAAVTATMKEELTVSLFAAVLPQDFYYVCPTSLLSEAE